MMKIYLLLPMFNVSSYPNTFHSPLALWPRYKNQYKDQTLSSFHLEQFFNLPVIFTILALLSSKASVCLPFSPEVTLPALIRHCTLFLGLMLTGLWVGLTQAFNAATLHTHTWRTAEMQARTLEASALWVIGQQQERSGCRVLLPEGRDRRKHGFL